MNDDTADSLLDMLALRLSAVPFHDLSANKADLEIPVNKSTTNPVTISFIGQLLDPTTSTNGNWVTFRSLVPFASHPEGLVLPVIRLVNTVVTGAVPTDGRSSEWLISGDLSIIGEDLAVVAQSLYPIDPSWGPQKRVSQICATGLLGGVVQKSQPSWTGFTIDSSADVSFEDLDWDAASICDRSTIKTDDVTWLDVAVGLARREESDPHHWLETRHALVSMKCRQPSREAYSAQKDRVLQNLEPITVVGQLLALNLETQEFFVQL